MSPSSTHPVLADAIDDKHLLSVDKEDSTLMNGNTFLSVWVALFFSWKREDETLLTIL